MPENTLAISKECEQRLIDRARVKWFDKGQIIYQEGQVPNAFWRVISGSVRIVNNSIDGKEVLFAIFSQGEFFGEISMVDHLPASNTAIANQKLQVYEISRTDFNYLHKQDTEFAQAIAKLLAQRLRHLIGFYEQVSLRPLESRIAHRLYYLAQNMRQLDSSTPQIQALQLTQQDIANMLGASRQAVSKIISLWQSEGILSIDYGKITLIDIDQLRVISNRI